MKLNNVMEALNSSEKASELDPSNKDFQENANMAAEAQERCPRGQ